MTITSSRLSPCLNNIIADPLILTYFTQYLQEIQQENIFRFWLEVSGCVSRRSITDLSNDNFTGEITVSKEQLNSLYERISLLPVTDTTTIYFRYLSKEAKLPIELPIELLCSSLVGVLNNPLNILSFTPLLRFAEASLRDDIFPNFLKSDLFKKFQTEIVLNGQLTLDDILFEDNLLVRFVEYLAGEPTSILVTFVLAINAYKKEYTQLMSFSETSAVPIDERHQQLIHDATTICAKYLSPASEDFMGLNLDQYRDVLDSACAEKEPRIECFDALYSIIHETIEKDILPAFFKSSPFLRYRAQFIPISDSETRYKPKPKVKSRRHQTIETPTCQLDVAALSKQATSNQLPNVYIKTNASTNGFNYVTKYANIKAAFTKRYRFGKGATIH